LKEINTIIFDIGDTLINLTKNTKKARMATIHYMANKITDIKDDDKTNAIFNTVLKESFQPHSDLYFLNFNYFDNVSKKLNILTDKKVIYDSLLYYQDYITSLTTPQQNLTDLLIKLKSLKYKLGIITDGKIHTTYRILYLLKILFYFDSIVVSEEVGHEKPHKDIFLKSLKELESTPSETMFIGNSLYRDIKGGNDCGITTVLLKGNKNIKSDPRFSPDYEITTLKDILIILKSS